MIHQHPSSYRDPAGFVFYYQGSVYRQINAEYKKQFEQLVTSGLFDKLVRAGLLINHEDVELSGLPADVARWKIIKPQPISVLTFVSEWCFDALKDAALLHLKVMQQSIQHQMILKDATPYNVQFINGAPVFIDTLSFELYAEEQPWIAYRQFCENFLYPLLLEHYGKLFVHQYFAAAPEGMNAVEVASMLPLKCRFKLGCWLHVYLAASVKGNNTKPATAFNRQKMTQLLSHLTSMVNSLQPGTSSAAGWSSYYADTILSKDYLTNKTVIVKDLIGDVNNKVVMDAGANDGHFSKLLVAAGAIVIATDNDAPSINRLYNDIRQKRKAILPLILDLAYPTPSIGFDNLERASFFERVKPDMIVALALIHHLVIGRNIPMSKIAAFFSSHCRILMIEFVPKADPKVQQMLSSRIDIFPDYTEDFFESVFLQYFLLEKKTPVPGTSRTIYLYRTADNL